MAVIENTSSIMASPLLMFVTIVFMIAIYLLLDNFNFFRSGFNIV
jgi:hypothetical protein